MGTKATLPLKERRKLKRDAVRKLDCECCWNRRQQYGCRGLCVKCYSDPGVRSQFPRVVEDESYEPTDDELDCIIKEQKKRLPWWWPQGDKTDLINEIKEHQS